MTPRDRSNGHDCRTHEQTAPIASQQSRLVAHASDRCVDAHDIVFAPLQAAGIFLFQTFAIAGLLVIIAGALIISGNPFAFALMSIAFIANFVVFFFRLFYPWPYNLHLLAAAWLIIAVTLGIVVARAVFGGGRITYHRVVGAVLLYLLIAVTFATLFAFVGLSIPDAFKGIAFEDDSALASALSI